MSELLLNKYFVFSRLRELNLWHKDVKNTSKAIMQFFQQIYFLKQWWKKYLRIFLPKLPGPSVGEPIQSWLAPGHAAGSGKKKFVNSFEK